MIASVIPALALPPHLNRFDYLVPPELEENICAGQLVEAPFRKKNAFGIVAVVQRSNLQNSEIRSPVLRPIKSIVLLAPLLSPTHLSFLSEIARLHRVSQGIVLKMMLPPIARRATKRVALSSFHSHSRILENVRMSLCVPATPNEIAPAYKKILRAAGQRLIVVPEEWMIARMAKALRLRKPVAYHRGLKVPEERSAWLRVRNDPRAVVIGTRAALFLPFISLRAIIVHDAHHDAHKSWDMSPRYDGRVVAEILAEYHGARLVFETPAPTVEQYGKFATTSPHPSLSRRGNTGEVDCHIRDMRNERRGGNFGPLAHATRDAISTALPRGDVVVLLNRTGTATSARCRDCGYMFHCVSCGQPMIASDPRHLGCNWCHTAQDMLTVCPNCRGPAIQLRGTGVSAVEQLLKKHYSLLPTRPQRLASSACVAGVAPYSLKVGTESVLKDLRWDRVALFVFADADAPLRFPDYRAQERMYADLRTVHFALQSSKKNPTLIAQTYNPEQSSFRAAFNSDPYPQILNTKYYNDELDSRKKFGYPPYTTLVRIIGERDTERALRIAAETLMDDLRQVAEGFRVRHASQPSLLPDTPQKIEIIGPYALHPPRLKGKWRMGILIKIPTALARAAIPPLVEKIPHAWTVDPWPIEVM